MPRIQICLDRQSTSFTYSQAFRPHTSFSLLSHLSFIHQETLLRHPSLRFQPSRLRHSITPSLAHAPLLPQRYIPVSTSNLLPHCYTPKEPLDPFYYQSRDAASNAPRVRLFKPPGDALPLQLQIYLAVQCKLSILVDRDTKRLSLSLHLVQSLTFFCLSPITKNMFPVRSSTKRFGRGKNHLYTPTMGIRVRSRPPILYPHHHINQLNSPSLTASLTAPVAFHSLYNLHLLLNQHSHYLLYYTTSKLQHYKHACLLKLRPRLGRTLLRQRPRNPDQHHWRQQCNNARTLRYAFKVPSFPRFTTNSITSHRRYPSRLPLSKLRC